MPKQLKKIKVKKPRRPRQPRRQGVPRKPHVTNISVNISGGSTNQPSGSYYFPNASQQVQPLVSNMFTPTMPSQNFEHNDSGTQTDMPSRVTRGMQSEPVIVLPSELNPNVTLRTRRNIAAGGGTLLPNPVNVPLDIIPPPILPRTPINRGQQETPSPSTPVIRVINQRRIDTPAPRVRAAGGGAGSRGGLSTLKRQEIHDLARTYNITTEGRNLPDLRNMISQQRRKGI